MPTRLGANLLQLRKKRRLTQKELAKLADLEQSEISKYERGTQPDVQNLVKLARALGVSLDQLIVGIHEENDLLRQTSGIPFASNERTLEGQHDAATDATARVLKEASEAYETLATEVRGIATQINAIVTRIERDPYGSETRTPQKKQAHKRSPR